MKLSDNQITKLASDVYSELKENDSVELNGDFSKLSQAIKDVVKQNLLDEAQLDNKVNLMMDELEKQNAASFERYKMFPLLKKKLAEQEGFVL